jgi:rhamnose utilization protein RhaD (predicted bifunctional aldolase and dehydrogenase)
MNRKPLISLPAATSDRSMGSTDKSARFRLLLRLSHELGNPQQPLAILGEGNASTRLGTQKFLVKASGSCLGKLTRHDIVECRSPALLALLDQSGVSDTVVNSTLMAARVDAHAKKPSVEALFHAYCLTLPDVEFVGHAHAPCVNSILCSPRAREFATKRIFPDEVVCCDVESVFVPYTDPGLPLAQEIRERVRSFIKRHARAPRVILLQNHGIITIGRSVDAVLAAMWMAEKAARIWLGAAVLGGPKFMARPHILRIAGRTDEQVRRKALRM